MGSHYRLIQGHALEALSQLESNSVQTEGRLRADAPMMIRED